MAWNLWNSLACVTPLRITKQFWTQQGHGRKHRAHWLKSSMPQCPSKGYLMQRSVMIHSRLIVKKQKIYIYIIKPYKFVRYPDLPSSSWSAQLHFQAHFGKGIKDGPRSWHRNIATWGPTALTKPEPMTSTRSHQMLTHQALENVSNRLILGSIGPWLGPLSDNVLK